MDAAAIDPTYTATIEQGQRLAAGGLHRRAAAVYQKAATHTGDPELKERALRLAATALAACQQAAAAKTRTANAAREADKLKAKAAQEAANEAGGAARRNVWQERNASQFAAARERWHAQDAKRQANREAWAKRNKNRPAVVKEAAAKHHAAKDAKRQANREKYEMETMQKEEARRAARAAYLRTVAGYVEQGLTPVQIAPLVHRDPSTVRTAIREIQATANAPAANDDTQAANDNTAPAEGVTA